MKINRRQSRINAIKLLYTVDVNKIDLSKAISSVFEDEIDDQGILFAKNVLDNLEKIDEIIEASLTNYSLSRLNLVDKAIIRLAVAEMLGETPAQIVINEAIEITKDYTDAGDNKAASFNNRLLDKIRISLNK